MVGDWQAAPVQGRTSPGIQQRGGSRGSSSLAPYVIKTLSHSRWAVRATADPDPGAGLKVALEMTVELQSEVDAGNNSRHGFGGGSRNNAETAPSLTPDNSRRGSWVWGWSGLDGDAGVSSRSWSTSGTTTGKDINTQCYLQ